MGWVSGFLRGHGRRPSERRLPVFRRPLLRRSRVARDAQFDVGKQRVSAAGRCRPAGDADAEGAVVQAAGVQEPVPLPTRLFGADVFFSDCPVVAPMSSASRPQSATGLDRSLDCVSPSKCLDRRCEFLARPLPVSGSNSQDLWMNQSAAPLHRPVHHRSRQRPDGRPDPPRPRRGAGADCCSTARLRARPCPRSAVASVPGRRARRVRARSRW